MAAMNQGPSVGVFWEIESCLLPPDLTGYEAVSRIRNVADSYGSVTLFNLYLEPSDGGGRASSLSPDTQAQLDRHAVSLFRHTKENQLKNLTEDMLCFALDNPTPATLMVVSGRSGLPSAQLFLRGYTVVLVVPPRFDSRGVFGSQASVILDWLTVILGQYTSNQAQLSAPNQDVRENINSSVEFEAGNIEMSSTRLTPTQALASSGRSSQASSENLAVSSSLPSAMPNSWRNTNISSSAGPSIYQTKRPIDSEYGQNTSLSRYRSSFPPSPLAEKPEDQNLLRVSTPSKTRPLYRPPHSGGRAANAPFGTIQREVDDNTAPPASASTPPWATSSKNFAPSTPTAFLHHPQTNLTSKLRDASQRPATSRSRRFSNEIPLARAQSERSSPNRFSLLLPGSGSSPSSNTSRDDQNDPEMLPHEVLFSGGASSASTSVAPIDLRVFSPLIKNLKELQEEGNHYPLRSVVGIRLNKSAYARAGVADFGQYVALAESMGLVELGGSGGTAWIKLQSY